MSVVVDQGVLAGRRDAGPLPSASRDPSTWAPNEHINSGSSIPFIALHFLPLLAFVTGVTWRAVWLAVALYFIRMLAITGGYHRYFSHRSYRLGRVSQFVLAFVGTTAAQKGPLWWAAHHRAHHKYSDTERDIHSPIRGFWWSHVGWILCDKFNKTDSDAIKDFTKYPELVWLDKHDWVGAVGARHPVLPDRRLERADHRLLRYRRSCCGTRRYASTRSRTCSAARRYDTPDTSRNSADRRAHHERRGLAQQPPPLPVGGPPGLPLVARST